MRQTTKKASHVLSVKRDKILFRKKIIQSSQPTTFSFKSVELATFSFKIATFLFKISIFFFIETVECDLFQNCQVCYFFIENYQVCHILTKLFNLLFFQLTLSSTLLFPFFNSDGLATLPFKTVDFVTLIRSSLFTFLLETIKLATFYSKLSSLLLFSI